jgi:hypothetical protein
MGLPHFHLVGGYRPRRRVQVDFLPLGIAKLARAHEHQRGQLQRARHHEPAAIGPQCPQQVAKLARVGDRGMVPDSRRLDGRVYLIHSPLSSVIL